MITPAASAPAPLTDDDVVELDDILAAVPEPYDPLDAVMLDGFLTCILLQPQLVMVSDWLALVFDAEGRAEAMPAEPRQAQRAIDLITRRYNELAASILAREPFDPIVFGFTHDKTGEPLGGKAALAAVTPWAAGFANALTAFPDLLQQSQEDDELTELLVGILRHLPDDELDGMLEVKAAVDAQTPLASLEEAIEDLVACVMEIADVTRPRQPVQRAAPKVGRNEQCPCGSGRKYKLCHGRGMQ